LPLPKPSSTGFSWYPAVNNAAAIAAIIPGGTLSFGGGVGGDRYLQYQYFNMETVFDYARSLNVNGTLFPLP
jgi:hypothetical protein